MPTLDLTAEEISLLGEILESYLARLRGDIADTDSKDYRDSLKERESAIKRLIARFEPKSAS